MDLLFNAFQRALIQKMALLPFLEGGGKWDAARLAAALAAYIPALLEAVGLGRDAVPRRLLESCAPRPRKSEQHDSAARSRSRRGPRPRRSWASPLPSATARASPREAA